ncbi:MAG: transcription antitermination factor NusB [Deltaproteobacteria bacterium]|nr:transcription antitermination factor NusB [Deltaproteobacteria bacterium]
MGSRRKSREAALKILFAMDATGQTAEEAIAAYLQNLAEEGESTDFTSILVRGVASKLAEIDEVIKSASQNWRIERMARVDRNILRLATYELYHVPDVPRRVSLNEAIELGKRYGAEDSPAFVNGILDRIAAGIQKE